MQVFISDLICLGKTRRIHCFWLVLLIVFSLTSCKKEQVATKEYPRLNTLEVTGISESGAIFSAELISGNRAEIIEYGFVWDTSLTPEINSDDKLVITGVPDNIKFSGNIHSALKKDIPYNVRAYVKTDKYLVYGKIVSFISMGSDAPVISSFLPESGTWGDTIKLKGKNFRYRMNGIVVKLGDIPATLISSTDTTINIVVPSVKNTEKVLLSVSVEGNNSVSVSPFSYLIPSISAINPLTATFNDTVFIHGNNFIRIPSGSKVYFNELAAAIVYSSKTLLKVLVPSSLKLSQSKLSITGPVSDIEFGPLFSLKGGVIILSVEPQRGVIGKSIVTLTGEQFSPEIDKNNLTINGVRAELLTLEERKITFKLPFNISSGESKIIISVNNLKSEYNGVFESVSPWTKKTDLSIQLTGYNSAFALNGKMYVQYRHSFNDNNFFEYNPATNQVEHLARYPGMMENMGVSFVLNGKGYIGAGCFYSSFSGLNEFHSYDPVADTWTKVGGLPSYTGPIYATAFSVQNKAYLFGGIGYHNTGAMNYSVYDLSSDKWSLLGNMQKFINYDEWSKAAGFVINDNIYLCGGYARNYYYGYSGYKKTWRFDVAKDQWTQLSDFPVEMEAPAGFSLNGKGYIGAGSSNGQGKSDFYEYDPVNDSWTRIADLPVKGSIGPVGVVIGGKAYISANNNTEIWEFDPLAH